jgi:hypothetical protein
MSDGSGDYRNTPVLINNFNRLRDLRRLVAWLQQAGQRKIVILDNASTLPALDAAYAAMAWDGVRVERLGQNAGSRAPWTLDLFTRLGIDGPFVYTDSDVVPDEECPPDLIGHLLAALEENSEFIKIGLGLRIDDLPDCYALKSEVVAWEGQFWRNPVGPGLFLAPVDTTFAIYRPGQEFALGPALRTGRPHRARHLGWYVDSAALDEEDRFYLATADRAHTNWSGGGLPDLLVEAIKTERRTRPALLHLSCGRDILPGWINVDHRAGPGIDIVFDPTRRNRLPLADDTIDGFFLRQADTGLASVLTALPELHRVARNNTKLLVRCPAPVPSLQRVAKPFHRFRGHWDITRCAVAPSRKGDEVIIELRAIKPPRRRRWLGVGMPEPTRLPGPVDRASTFP